MKRALLLILIVTLVATSARYAWGRKDCQPDGERMDLQSGEQPGWFDKTHFSNDRYEYFVGLSTQNKRVEGGKKLAMEEAKKAAIESIGELLQSKYQSILTMRNEDSAVQDALGNLHAPTFLRERNVSEWYWEKWVSYSRCAPTYYYNVWVLLKVPKAALEAEKQKAVTYLQKAQEQEMEKKPPVLLPDINLTRKDLPSWGIVVSKYEPPPPPEEETEFPQWPIWTAVTAAVLGGIITAAYFAGDNGWGSSSGGSSGGGTSGGGSGGGISVNVPLP